MFTSNFDLVNYADDNTPYEFSISIDDVINKLEQDSKILIEWGEMNYLKPNPDKWHLLLSHTDNNLTLNIGNECK